MATKKMDSAEVENAIAAVRDRTMHRTVPASEQIQLQNLRYKLNKELEPIFERAGLDVEGINRILTQHQKDVRKILEEHKSQIDTNLAAQGENLRTVLTQRSRTLDHIANKPFLTTIVPLQEASLIFATPVGLLSDNNWGIEPGHNWGKIKFEFGSQDTFQRGGVYLRFYFFWQNTSDYSAVLNAMTELSALGDIWAQANPGWFSGGSSQLDVGADFDVYVGEQDYHPEFSVVIQQVVANGGGGGWFGSGDLKHQRLEGQPIALSCSNIEVDAGQFAVFVVTFDAGYDADDGYVNFDFQSDGDSIICPGVNLEVLTPASQVSLGSQSAWNFDGSH